MNENMYSNLTTEKKASFSDLPPRHVALIGFEVGIVSLIDITALLGNILVCCAIYRNVRLRTEINYPIVSLAISDLLFAIVYIPFSLGALIHGKWIYGNCVCAMQALFHKLSCLSLHINNDIHSNKPLLQDRAINSKLPEALHQTQDSSRYCNNLVCSIRCDGSPTSYQFSIHRFLHTKSVLCFFIQGRSRTQFDRHVYDYSYFCGNPLDNHSGYLRTGLCVHSEAQGEHSGQHAVGTKRGRNQNHTNFACVSWWFFSLLASHSVHLSPSSVSGVGRSLRSLHMTYSILGALSCAINPVIYGVMNQSFRKEFLHILSSCASTTTAEI